MDLSEIKIKFPWINIASEENNSELLDFIESQSFGNAQLKLRYSRRPDFFEFLRYQGDESVTFFTRNPLTQKMNGMASLILRTGYWDGKLQVLGYLGDLRIGYSRQNLREWKRCMCEVLKLVRFQTGCSFFLTAIVDDNQAARRSLVDRKNMGFSYTPLVSYKMVNVLGRKFWKSRSKILNPYNFVQWRESSQDEKFLRFLDSQQSGLPFGWNFTAMNFSGWQSRRSSFKRESFFFICDSDNQPVLGAALWSPKAAKRIQVDHSKYARWPLLKNWLKIPTAGEVFSVAYLTHFVEASALAKDLKLRSALRKLFIEKIWNENTEKFLALLDYPELHRQQDLQSNFFTQSIPMKLYVVHLDDDSVLKSVPAQACWGTGFELALV